jgi:GalNAc5-diNAcBac-PP-undecaprenol beta-1,3-glucosyltransferase
MTQATVVVPTFDHGPMLLRSVRSALSQTVEDLEVFVVGDGVPDVTREVTAELEREDERVRFFDNPKGPRHGEAHRHAALQQARGEIVCYLSDDDLWLPDHVETMRRLLVDADFASALPTYVDEKGKLGFILVDLSVPTYRELMLSGTNRVPLSCGAHTLETYRKLPHGWRTTPQGKPTDLHMWQQILADPGCTAVSSTRPTVLFFPSPQRGGWTLEDRLAELDRWIQKVSDAAWRDRFVLEVLDAVVKDYAEETVRLRTGIERQRQGTERQRQRADRLHAAHQEAVDLLSVHKKRAEVSANALARERRASRLLKQQIREVRVSRTWTWLTRVARARDKILRRSSGDRPGR